MRDAVSSCGLGCGWDLGLGFWFWCGLGFGFGPPSPPSFFAMMPRCVSPMSPYISVYLRISPYVSVYLPCNSPLYLLLSRRLGRGQARGAWRDVGEISRRDLGEIQRRSRGDKGRGDIGRGDIGRRACDLVRDVLYLPYIFPTSPLYLPSRLRSRQRSYISPISPTYLPSRLRSRPRSYISPISPTYLPHISPGACDLVRDVDVGPRLDGLQLGLN